MSQVICPVAVLTPWVIHPREAWKTSVNVQAGHHLPTFEWLQTETAPLSGAAFCDARRMVPRAGSK
jgi:hypothetical protein